MGYFLWTQENVQPPSLFKALQKLSSGQLSSVKLHEIIVIAIVVPTSFYSKPTLPNALPFAPVHFFLMCYCCLCCALCHLYQLTA